MPLEKGGGSNGSRHCGRNSSRLCSYIRAFCASFSFFLPLFKFHGGLHVYRDQCFEGVFLLCG